MNKRMIFILIAIFLLSGCSDKNYNDSSIQKAVSKTNIEIKSILYKEEVDDGIVLFYETLNQEGLNIGYLRKTTFGLKWVTGGGVAEPISDEGLSWAWTRIDEGVSYFYGVVRNPRIEKIHVRDSKGNIEEAKIVKGENDVLIWFIKRSDDYRGQITGLSKEGQVLYTY